MKRIIKPRCKGQTTDLIRLASEYDYYMVVRNRDEAHRVFQQALDAKITIRLPITFNEFLNKDYLGKHIKGFVIDDVDIFIQQMTNVPVKAIAINYKLGEVNATGE